MFKGVARVTGSAAGGVVGGGGATGAMGDWRVSGAGTVTFADGAIRSGVVDVVGGMGVWGWTGCDGGVTDGCGAGIEGGSTKGGLIVGSMGPACSAGDTSSSLAAASAKELTIDCSESAGDSVVGCGVEDVAVDGAFCIGVATSGVGGWGGVTASGVAFTALCVGT